MRTRPLISLALALVMGGAVAAVQHFSAPPKGSDLSEQAPAAAGASWSEVDWPFLRDGWPNGRAFRCEGAPCADAVMVYARVKVGFCDCSRGVADDDDLDRVGDAELVDERFTPTGAGQARNFAGMNGRLRLYRARDNGPAILVIAGGRNCNAFAGMATTREAFTSATIEAVARFFDDPAMSRWIAEKQGG